MSRSDQRPSPDRAAADPVARADGVTRRRVFAVGGAGAVALGAAACGSSKKSGSKPNGTEAAAGSASSAGSPTATPSGAASSGAASKGSGTASKGSGTAPMKGIAKLSDIKVGSAISAKDSGGKPVIVGRPAKDSVVCFSAICTHMGCTVNPAGAKLICPCHGSQYNALTGAVLHGPAPKALAKVNVKLDGQEVVQT
ncbi:MAG: ubiquinol-cytochrome c reductase iron-sulfur subunit [Mycobacteriales bacterium]